LGNQATYEIQSSIVNRQSSIVNPKFQFAEASRLFQRQPDFSR
jgi:hypothetical protein